MTPSFIAMVAVVIACVAGDPPGDKARPGPDDLQGTWKIVTREVDGKLVRFPANLPRWVIKGDKVYYGGELLATLTVDDKTTPRSLDLAFHDSERQYEAGY